MSESLARRAGAPAAFLGILLIGSALAPADTIQDVVNQVDANQYMTYQIAVEGMGLGSYDANYNQGYRNRDGWAGDGSLGNQEARRYLADKLAAMGLSVTIQGTYKNVVAELPGTVEPNKIYIVGAHYDHINDGTVGAGDHPGGDDNASGTAGVLEAARILSQYQFRYTIRFIGFNAEEDGLLGSRDYVSSVVQAGNENVAGMIALDMILRPLWDADANQPKDLDLGTRSDTGIQKDWVDAFVAAGAAYVPSLVIDPNHKPYTSQWGGSDHQPFVDADLAAFLAIENAGGEIWGGSNAYYHTYDDAHDRLAGALYDYAFAADVVRATVATLAQEAELVPEPASMVILGVGAIGLLVRRRWK